jgi:hypothetical protein
MKFFEGLSKMIKIDYIILKEIFLHPNEISQIIISDYAISVTRRRRL